MPDMHQGISWVMQHFGVVWSLSPHTAFLRWEMTHISTLVFTARSSLNLLSHPRLHLRILVSVTAALWPWVAWLSAVISPSETPSENASNQPVGHKFWVSHGLPGMNSSHPNALIQRSPVFKTLKGSSTAFPSIATYSWRMTPWDRWSECSLERPTFLHGLGRDSVSWL